jgi:hypothetical protein
MRLNYLTKFKSSLVKMSLADNYQHLVGKTLIEAGQEASIQKTDNHVSIYLFTLIILLLTYEFLGFSQ